MLAQMSPSSVRSWKFATEFPGGADARVRAGPLVRLLNHTEKFLGAQHYPVSEEADEGVGRGPGGPPHHPTYATNP